jgi:hypothetical protein
MSRLGHLREFVGQKTGSCPMTAVKRSRKVVADGVKFVSEEASLSRFTWAVVFTLLASNARAQQHKPRVPDIPAMKALWASLKSGLTAHP